MDDQQRAALRYDRLASAIRRSKAIAEGYTTAGDIDDIDDIFVLGRHNPELLMGHELMGWLVVVYSPETEVGRKFRARWWQPGIERFGSDFWTKFHDVAAPFIELDIARLRDARARSARNDAAAAQNIEAEASEEDEPAEDQSGTRHCLLRANALAAARVTFGREKFDAFLYEVIAPEAGVIETSSSSPESMADLFLWAEGGCQ